ncbi:MAG: DsrE/DsrF/TusD sulfur relay family protein [Spirochaetota bacterium]
MKVLLIINDPPYGTEKAYNALRLAMSLQKEHEDAEVRIFLLGDAVNSAVPNQKSPQGYYNLERMLKSVINKGGQVKACGSCSVTRGINSIPLIEGVEINTMSQLATWVKESDRVITF